MREDLTWEEIIGELREQLPDLTDDFIREFKAGYAYQGAKLSDADLVDTASQTLELLVSRLAKMPDPQDLQNMPERLGARRARQGVTLDELTSAVRLDFRVIWKRLEVIVDKGSAQVLADNVTRLLDTVEKYVNSIQHSYREEEANLLINTHIVRQRRLLKLFSEGGISSQEAGSIAAGLELDPRARFEVVAVLGDAIEPMQIRYGSSRRVFLYELAGVLCIFRVHDQKAGWMDAPAEVPGGYVGNIQGISAVPSAARVAILIARNADPSRRRLATVQDVWPEISRKMLGEHLDGFTDRVLVPLRGLPSHERERLTESVLAYLHSGSIKETAEQLFCHRNTVINRLRTFEDITGLNPMIPTEAAWILVALGGRMRV